MVKLKWLEKFNPLETSFSPRSDKELKVAVVLLVSLIWLLLPLAGLPGHTDVWLTAVALVAGAIASYGWYRDDELARSYQP
jgi:hypothetical protein